MGNHKGDSRKSRHRRFSVPFSTPISTLFRACGLVVKTEDKDLSETLLTGVGTALAALVILASAILAQKEGPLQPPLSCLG